ncbi:MFS transporter [Loigolactobacillus bifermentans]|uniref:Transmembrane transport protein n=1 Tax=Loigolactobacillus bifermentans DSM 20003 TaxID=1423726 RepID=A0A0R1H0B2_9LACO|nr:MFS transporter [Loigolactobacillus bifermentans]KRK40061.1 transmembrane transport protein [Loigolactobacillus bifermentans DSM 20003]QGG61604.1 MFS transporter [Loigolactobacillus bifermentans]
MKNETVQSPSKAKNRGLLMLVILWLAYVMFAMNWVAGSTLSPQIIHTFFGQPMSPVVTQLVNYTITAARVVANFLAAFVLIKLGPKRSANLAMTMLAFALLAVWLPNYWAYTVARMIMALGGSMIIVYMNPVVGNYVAQDKKMIANALNTVSYNVGAFVTSMLFVGFAKTLQHNWRLTLTSIASVTIVLLVIWLFTAENFDASTDLSARDEHQIAYTYSDAFKDPFVWKYAIGFSGFLFLYILAVTSFPSVLPEYATKINGSLINVLVTGSAIIGTIVGMRIGLTNARRIPVMFVSGVMMIAAYAAVLWLAASAPLLAYIAAAISGFFMFIQYPIYMNLPHEMPHMSGEKLTMIFGLFWAIAYLMNTVLTITWSVILGQWGWGVASGFYIIAACLYLVFVVQLPETKK